MKVGLCVLVLLFCFVASLSAEREGGRENSEGREKQEERTEKGTFVVVNQSGEGEGEREREEGEGEGEKEREIEEEWESFKKKFHKKYSSAEEEKKRQKIFRENVRGVAKRKYSSMSAGITKFFDLTLQEFKLFTSKGVRPMERKKKEGERKLPSVSDWPLSWDWEEKGDVTPVKNEGQCGATWAMAAIDVLESACKIAGYPLTTLSTQQVMDCNKEQYGCNGGFPQIVFETILDEKGIESDQSYPYSGPNSTNKCTTNPAKFSACKVAGYINITVDQSEFLFFNFLFRQSPIVVCVEAGQQAFMDYTGGVLTSQDCPGTTPDHCLALVGWVNINGKRVWKLKNQWGADWGEKGYVYFEIGTNTCGIDSPYACLPVVVPK